MDSKLTRVPVRWFVVMAAIGCLAGLLAWPDTPQDRFLAVLLGVVGPFAVYGLVRLVIAAAAWLWARVRQHNWRQFSLRGMLAFTILCAIGSLIWSWTRPDIRYRRMRERQQLAAAVEVLGGNLDGALIRLNGQVIYDGDLESLASLPGAQEVQAINLDGTGVTDEVTKYLTQFPKLKNISMNGCLAITDGALEPLHANRKLRFFSAAQTQITEAGAKALKDANHLMAVYWGDPNRIFVKGPFDAKPVACPDPPSICH